MKVENWGHKPNLRTIKLDEIIKTQSLPEESIFVHMM